MHRPAPFLTAVLVTLCVATSASAQFKNVFSFSEDAVASSGMQIYFDFDPGTTTAPPSLPPPQGPVDADLHVTVNPLPLAIGPTPSGSFALVVSDAINDAFRDNEWFDPELFFARTGAGLVDEESGHNATVEVFSPVDLYAIYTSPSAGSPPGTLLGGPPGNSHNPTISLRTAEIRNAWPGTPNTQLQINGRDPAANDFHVIEQEVPGTLNMVFAGQPFSPILLLTSPQYLGGAVDLSVLGVNGTLDLTGAISTVFDSFNPTTVFDALQRTDATGTHVVNGALGAGQFLGASSAFQAVMLDPTAPLGLGLTQSADLHLAEGRTLNLPLAGDGTTMVQLGSGKAFEFYGTSYTRLFINENGFITFGVPPTPGATQVIDPVSSLQNGPGLFVHMGDYDAAGSVIQYREFGSQARIRWGSLANPISHANASDQAVFSATLTLTVPPGTTPPSQSETHDDAVMSIARNAGAIYLDWFVLDSQVALGATGFDTFVGISPGSLPNAAQVVSRDFGAIQAPTTPQPFQPLVSLDDFDSTAATPLAPESGGPQRYNDGASFSGSSLGFFAIDVGGQPSYYSVPDNSKPDDVQAVSPQQLSRSQGAGSALGLRLFGKFKYFDRRASTAAPKGTVTLLHASGVSIPAAALRVFSNTPPSSTPGPTSTPVVPIPVNSGVRDFEALDIEIPPGALNVSQINPGDTLDIVVTFPNPTSQAGDKIFVLPAAITVVP